MPLPVTLKVVLLGDSGVGKTSVMNRFLGELFDSTFIMTKAGETVRRKKLVVNNHNVVLELWDAPGNEGFRTYAAAYLKDAKAVIVFFDVSNRASFENIEDWLDFLPCIEGVAQQTPTFIIGNKTDKRERVVRPEEAEHKAKNRGSLYFETSAKTNDTDYFVEIFKILIEDVLDKSELSNSGSLQRPTPETTPWYKNCVLL